MKTKFCRLAVLFFLVFVCDDVKAQAPIWQWAKSVGGSHDENAFSVTTDALGNIIVVGSFDGPTMTFGTTTLTNASQTNYNDIFIVKYSPSGTVLWAKSGGGTDWEDAIGVTADASGNLIVVGEFQSSTMTFGTTVLTNASQTNDRDMFIVKYDPNGTVLWAKSAGGSNDEIVTSIAADAAGNLIVAGGFTSPTIIFDAFTLTNVTPNINPDAYIVKYDPTGSVLWAKSAGGILYDDAQSVTADANGNIIVEGGFLSPTITFGTITLTNTVSAYASMFIVKYDPAGVAIWAKSVVGGGSYSVTTDVPGNIIIAGWFRSPTITFDSITLTNVNADSADMFIVKYDPAGTALWAKTTGGSKDDEAYSVTADASGNLIVSGLFFSPAITFGSTILTNANQAIYSCDIFIVKYDPIGSMLWTKSAGGVGYEGIQSATHDAFGSLIVVGGFNSPTLAFDAITLIKAGGAGSPDMFIAKLNNITGIENLTSNNNISVYPNPTTNQLHLTLTKPLPPNTAITITDMQGRVVKAIQVITPGGEAIDVSTLTQGVYLLKVNGQVQRFVKMY